ncbi:MAG: acylphosphatase [Spirochaetes bacterium]|nr:acylphosphatase [Spirochaetota bacterium]
MEDLWRFSIIFEGLVQGVGFRYFVQRVSLRMGITGYVRNEDDGTVFAVFETDESSFNNLIEIIKKGNGYSRIYNMNIKKEKIIKREFNDFFIDY